MFSRPHTHEIPDIPVAWRAMQPLLSAKRLIFLDETVVTTNMVRRYGRGPRGKRVLGYAPAGHCKITTLLGSLASHGMNRAGFAGGHWMWVTPPYR